MQSGETIEQWVAAFGHRPDIQSERSFIFLLGLQFDCDTDTSPTMKCITVRDWEIWSLANKILSDFYCQILSCEEFTLMLNLFNVSKWTKCSKYVVTSRLYKFVTYVLLRKKKDYTACSTSCSKDFFFVFCLFCFVFCGSKRLVNLFL